MSIWLCAFDLEDATAEDYEKVYLQVHKNGGSRYWKENGKYYRYPSTNFKLPMESTSPKEALDELDRFLKSCTTKKIPHTAVGKEPVTASSVPIDAELVPQEIQDLLG